MLEIVLLFAVFCVGVVGVGVLSTGKIKDYINQTMDKVKNNKSQNIHNLNLEYDNKVKTAEVEINPESSTIYANINDIYREAIKAKDMMSCALKDNFNLLKEVGLDKVNTDEEFDEEIGKSVARSTIEHEAGHVLAEKGSNYLKKIFKYGTPKSEEVIADTIYKSAVNDKLTAENKLDYSVSLMNLITYGGEKGYNTALDVFETLKDTYGYAAFAIGTIVNKALDSVDKKVVYGEQKRTVDFGD
ncbi:MAG: hypothetical protein KAJ88_02940 [Candidatus Aenigmarchaeota archaeon]|nr:hypothetical protein [Candidatus Aenigmarchaeota archaeon]